MGIGRAELDVLLAARRAGVSFTRTLMVSRQELHCSHGDVAAAFAAAGFDPPPAASRWADPVLRALGCEELTCSDASPYEGADLIIDLNDPPHEPPGQFDLVLECGTLEHVYFAPAALRFLARLVTPGGVLLAVAPCDGWAGHGFYQFSPEWFHRALSKDAGFSYCKVALAIEGRRGTSWFRVEDAADAGRRIEFAPRGRTSLAVCARRDTAGLEGTERPPVQSDYARAWDGGASAVRRSRIPAPLRRRALRLRRWAINLPNSGLDPRFFQKIATDDLPSALKANG